jgi:O-methyltransferase
MIKKLYKIMQFIISKFGYDFVINKKYNNLCNYENINVNARYAPWNTDYNFIFTYNKIKNNTLVDKYRCYELWQLVKHVSKLPEGAIMEVGTWKGGSGALICKCAKYNNIKDDIYLCDTFAGVVKTSNKDSLYVDGEHSDTNIDTVNNLLGELNIDNVRILKGIFPDDTSNEVIHDKFRMCHIDVDVYQSAKDVLEWIWPKMVIGGVVIFDDYGFDRCNGIARLVDRYMNYNDRIIIYNLNGHAIMIKQELI